MTLRTRKDQESASVTLARLCGWQYFHGPIGGTWELIPDGSGDEIFLYDDWQRTGEGDTWDIVPLNLYDPANMALAWRVLNWAVSPPGISPAVNEYETIKGAMDRWWFHPPAAIWPPCYIAPAEAQRAWLDKILELAIEAGLVAAANEPQ